MNKELMLSDEQIVRVSGGVLQRVAKVRENTLKGTYQIVFVSCEGEMIIVNKLEIMATLCDALNKFLQFKATEEDVKRSFTHYFSSLFPELLSEVHVERISMEPNNNVVIYHGFLRCILLHFNGFNSICRFKINKLFNVRRILNYE